MTSPTSGGLELHEESVQGETRDHLSSEAEVMMAASQAATTPGRRVLVVDDDPAVRSSLGALLSDYDVEPAESVAEAYAALGRAGCQVAVVDCQLPDGSGLDLVARIRKDQPDFEAILLTGHADVASAAEAVRLGVHAYLEKPWDGRRLRTLVEEAFGKVHRGELRAQIERKSVALQEELDRVRESEMRDRLATVGMMAAGVAHEIGNPAAFVSANVEVFGERLRELAALLAPDHPSPEVLEILRDLTEMQEDCMEGVRRIRSLTRDLRTFAAVGDDEEEGSCDPNVVMESTLRLAYHEIRRRGRLVKDLHSATQVRGHPSRIGQVFLNLIVNAAHALEGASGERAVYIRSRRRPPSWVEVQFEDTGTGMTPEVLARVFEPFFTTKPPGVGTGLGLSLCRRILDAVGGTLAIESTAGAGTTVTVLLAEVPDEAPAQPPRARPLPSAAQSLGRILVVDDEIDMVKALARILRPRAEVLCAHDVETAIEMLRTCGPFDAVVSDIVMYPVDGLQLLARAEALDPAYRSRFIFLSASPKGIARVPEDLRPRLLSKPIDQPSFLALLTKTIRGPSG